MTCRCGCGASTKNEFAPGHDARYKGMLLRYMKEGHSWAKEELVERGWLRNTRRFFGVEIEFDVTDIFTSSTMDIVVDELVKGGIPCRRTWYDETEPDTWALKTDASCGLELVSPKLSGKSGMDQVKKVCRILKSISFVKITDSCGLHIHHDASGLTASQIVGVAAAYTVHQDQINKLVRRNRTSNSYCLPLSLDTIRELYNSIARGNTLTNAVIHSNVTRYSAVNLCSYAKHGTIEFRQLQGTLDADVILTWLKFGQGVISSVQRGVFRFSRFQEYTEITEYETSDNLMLSQNDMSLLSAKAQIADQAAWAA